MLIPKFDLYKTEWLDLVFNNRNKNYGAYELRSHYSAVMTKATLITVVGVVGSALLIGLATKHQQILVNPIVEDTTVVHIKDINQIKQLKPKLSQVPPPAASHVKSVAIPTHVTADEQPTIDPPTKADIATAAVGSEKIDGTNNPLNVPVAKDPGNGTAKTVPEESASNNAPLDFAEVSPEPLGGMAGWARYLQKNLRYPDTEVQGRVLISFVVERDGSLSDIKLVRGVDSRLDAEAMRVLRLAPKWKPGLQAGKAVRVQYTIPINFQLSN